MITHEPNKAFFDDLIKNDFKAFQLKSMDGELLVPYNKPNKSAESQAKTIITRFKLLSDGIYQLYACYSHSHSLKPECFYIAKGKIQNNQLNETQPTHPVRQTKEEKTSQNVLSLDSALSRIEELSKLRAENEVLKQRIRDLEIENNELENEIDEQPELSEEKTGTDKITNWLTTIMPTLSPLADAYFQTQNRKLAIEEQKLLNLSKKNPYIKKTTQMNSLKNYPDIHNDDELNSYFDMLEKLSDDDFEKVCQILSIENPELFEIVTDTFFEDDIIDESGEGAE
jgi:hypothetical protein